jgi:two-component system, chemotaxis family, CheB/CheR fusion protein
LQSTNEEMQSTNEELETSREELQSVNEELITVNAELQAKIEQLSDMQNDMKNLLDNFSVGTIFLDEHMHIRRFTREVLHIYRLVASDVGRPLYDIKSDFEDDDLLVDAQTVLNTLVPSERELRAASGSWYLVRIQPYRTLDNVIAGVVISFTDISQRVKAEVEIREALLLAENIVNTVHEPLLVLDSEMTVVSASRSFFSYFNTASQETVGKSIFALGNGQWDIRALRELLETVLPRDTSFDGFVVEHDFPEIGQRKLLLNARRIKDEASDHPLILLAIKVGVG